MGRVQDQMRALQASLAPEEPTSRDQFECVEDEWKFLPSENLMALTVKDLLSKRLMAHFKFAGDDVYVVTAYKDENALRAKKPAAVIVNISDIIKFWTKHISFLDQQDPITQFIPSLLMIQKVFPGAKVVSYS